MSGTRTFTFNTKEIDAKTREVWISDHDDPIGFLRLHEDSFWYVYETLDTKIVAVKTGFNNMDEAADAAIDHWFSI